MKPVHRELQIRNIVQISRLQSSRAFAFEVTLKFRNTGLVSIRISWDQKVQTSRLYSFEFRGYVNIELGRDTLRTQLSVSLTQAEILACVPSKRNACNMVWGMTCKFMLPLSGKTCLNSTSGRQSRTLARTLEYKSNRYRRSEKAKRKRTAAQYRYSGRLMGSMPVKILTLVETSLLNEFGGKRKTLCNVFLWTGFTACIIVKK